MTFPELSDNATASCAHYAIGAWLVAVVPSLVYFFVLIFIGVDSLRPPRRLDPVHAAYIVLAAPALETALMFPVAKFLAQAIPRQPWLRVILLAALGALAHRIGGTWEQAIASFWPFLVYSVTLNAWMRRSKRTAFALTSVVHALYNATFLAVGVLGTLITNSATIP